MNVLKKQRKIMNTNTLLALTPLLLAVSMNFANADTDTPHCVQASEIAMQKVKLDYKTSILTAEIKMLEAALKARANMDSMPCLSTWWHCLQDEKCLDGKPITIEKSCLDYLESVRKEIVSLRNELVQKKEALKPILKEQEDVTAIWKKLESSRIQNDDDDDDDFDDYDFDC